MSNDGLVNRVIDHVDPSRRDFVKRVLAGAAFAAPVVASFSIESLFVNSAYGQSCSGSANSSNISNSCRCLADPGYVGPAVFQCYVEDTSGNTRVNGEVSLNIDRDDRDGHRDGHDDDKGIDIRLDLTQGATVTSAYLTINGQEVASVQLHESHGFGPHDLTGKISVADITGLCDFDALLQAMAAQTVVAVVQGTYSGTSFNAQGPVSAASGSPIIEIKA